MVEAAILEPNRNRKHPARRSHCVHRPLYGATRQHPDPDADPSLRDYQGLTDQPLTERIGWVKTSQQTRDPRSELQRAWRPESDVTQTIRKDYILQHALCVCGSHQRS